MFQNRSLIVLFEFVELSSQLQSGYCEPQFIFCLTVVQIVHLCLIQFSQFCVLVCYECSQCIMSNKSTDLPIDMEAFTNKPPQHAKNIRKYSFITFIPENVKNFPKMSGRHQLCNMMAFILNNDTTIVNCVGMFHQVICLKCMFVCYCFSRVYNCNLKKVLAKYVLSNCIVSYISIALKFAQ